MTSLWHTYKVLSWLGLQQADNVWEYWRHGPYLDHVADEDGSRQQLLHVRWMLAFNDQCGFRVLWLNWLIDWLKFCPNQSFILFSRWNKCILAPHEGKTYCGSSFDIMINSIIIIQPECTRAGQTQSPTAACHTTPAAQGPGTPTAPRRWTQWGTASGCVLRSASMCRFFANQFFNSSFERIVLLMIDVDKIYFCEINSGQNVFEMP